MVELAVSNSAIVRVSPKLTSLMLDSPAAEDQLAQVTLRRSQPAHRPALEASSFSGLFTQAPQVVGAKWHLEANRPPLNGKHRLEVDANDADWPRLYGASSVA